MFKGSLCALITPFSRGRVDEKAFQQFVDWQIKQGTHGVVPVGTTGESPTLSHEEHRRVIRIVVEAAAGKYQELVQARGPLTQRYGEAIWDQEENAAAHVEATWKAAAELLATTDVSPASPHDPATPLFSASPLYVAIHRYVPASAGVDQGPVAVAVTRLPTANAVGRSS